MAIGVNTRLRAQMKHVAEITGTRKGNGRAGIRKTRQDRKTDRRTTAREVREGGRTTIGKPSKPGRNRGSRKTAAVETRGIPPGAKSEESAKVS